MNAWYIDIMIGYATTVAIVNTLTYLYEGYKLLKRIYREEEMSINALTTISRLSVEDIEGILKLKNIPLIANKGKKTIKDLKYKSILEIILHNLSELDKRKVYFEQEILDKEIILKLEALGYKVNLKIVPPTKCFAKAKKKWRVKKIEYAPAPEEVSKV